MTTRKLVSKFEIAGPQGNSMDSKLLQYEGREQSFIKHEFLTTYLKRAAYKTMQGRSPVFNFVDAFAGPWRVKDNNDYSDASFDQALRTLDAVRADLLSRKLAEPRIRFCFCEKKSSRAKELKRYAQSRTNFEIQVFEGTFEDNLDPISASLKDGFTFTFVDPTGWNIRNHEVFRFLRNQKGEFLLNFMSDHINRHSRYEAVAESFGRFLADPDWEEQFNAISSTLSNEEKVLQILKGKMKDAGVAKYLPDLSIMEPRQDRRKMRLILGTHSSKGVELFRDVQAKVEKQEIEVRHDIKHNEEGQGSLFTTAQHVEIEVRRIGVGCPESLLRAEEVASEFLRNSSYREFRDVSTRVMELVAVRKTHIKDLMCEMRKRGLVSFSLPKGKRKPEEGTRISAKLQ